MGKGKLAVSLAALAILSACGSEERAESLPTATTYSFTDGGFIPPDPTPTPPGDGGTIATDSRFVYVVNNAADSISEYAWNSDGSVAAIGSVATKHWPNAIAVHPSQRFFYVPNMATDDISIFSRDAESGLLTRIGDMAAGREPRASAMHPSGRYLFVGHHDGASLNVYSIDANTGALALSDSRATGGGVRSVAVSQSGTSVYVAAKFAGRVDAFSFDVSTGRLTPTQVLAAGTYPIWAAVAPDDSGVYVSNEGSDETRWFARAANGTLTAGAILHPAGGGATCLLFNPAGTFVFALNWWQGTLTAYQRNATTGALTLSGSVFAGTAPSEMVFDSARRLAFATLYGSAELVTYAIDPATGAMAERARVPAGAGAHSVAITE